MLGETDKAFQALEQTLKDDPVDLVTWIRRPNSILSGPTRARRTYASHEPSSVS